MVGNRILSASPSWHPCSLLTKGTNQSASKGRRMAMAMRDPGGIILITIIISQWMRVTRKEVIGYKSKRRLVTRELYLRNDISCRSLLCSSCTQSLPALLSSSESSFYVIPDVSFVLHFLEILVCICYLCNNHSAFIFVLGVTSSEQHCAIGNCSETDQIAD